LSQSDGNFEANEREQKKQRLTVDFKRYSKNKNGNAKESAKKDTCKGHFKYTCVKGALMETMHVQAGVVDGCISRFYHNHGDVNFFKKTTKNEKLPFPE